MRSKELIGVLVALCALATTAPAAIRRFSDDVGGNILLTSANRATWEVNNSIGTTPESPFGTCTESPGLAVRDGVLDPTGENRPDAFDGAVALWVNNQRFVAPDSVDVTDQRLTAGPVSLAGLRVTVEYRALQSSAMLRALVTFENPTNLPFEGSFTLGTNFGSDTLTAERGKGLPSKNWHVTSDSATAPTDPVILMVSSGPDPFAAFGDFDLLTVGEWLSDDGVAFTCNTSAGRQQSITSASTCGREPLLAFSGRTARARAPPCDACSGSIGPTRVVRRSMVVHTANCRLRCTRSVRCSMPATCIRVAADAIICGGLRRPTDCPGPGSMRCSSWWA